MSSVFENIEYVENIVPVEIVKPVAFIEPVKNFELVENVESVNNVEPVKYIDAWLKMCLLIKKFSFIRKNIFRLTQTVVPIVVIFH